MTLQRPKIEVILPVYNEVQNLVPLLRELDKSKAMLSSQADVGFLFVNDGSTDGSTEILHKLFKERSDVRVVDLIHNFGHSAALSCGIEYFQGDIAVVMDADLQDAPESMLQMFEAWKKGSKTVVAERGERKERNKWAFQLFYYFLNKLTKNDPPIQFGTHCLLDRSVVSRLKGIKEKNRYFPGLVAYSSQKIAPIRIDRNERKYGKSRVGYIGLLNLAMTAFLSFSSTPVKFVSLVGILCSVGAIVSSFAIIFLKFFTERAIPGWASMMTAIAFGSGIQLMCLGIIGEYIARIYDEVKDRPLFLVDKILSKTSVQTRVPAEIAEIA